MARTGCVRLSSSARVCASFACAAMQARSIPVTYVLFPDEGHGFARQPNRTAFNAVAETFLAQCLGGSYQPVGDDFAGSSITVPTGADRVQDLGSALSAKK